MNPDSLCAAYALSPAMANAAATTTYRNSRRRIDDIACKVAGHLAEPAVRHVPDQPSGQADVSDAHNGLRSRLVGWWRTRLRRRQERIQLETLAPLSKQMLQDIGMSEEMRSLALAQHESNYERLTRSVEEIGRLAGRLGPW